VRLKVVSELARGDEEGVQHLLRLRVPDFAVRKDLNDIVDRSLDGIGLTFFRSFRHQDRAGHLCGRGDVKK
jgi:hypothetical protein